MSEKVSTFPSLLEQFSHRLTGYFSDETLFSMYKELCRNRGTANIIEKYKGNENNLIKQLRETMEVVFYDIGWNLIHSTPNEEHEKLEELFTFHTSSKLF